MTGTRTTGWTRRRVLASGLGAAAAALAGGVELVDRGVLPGKHTLDELDGACSVNAPAETFRRPGATVTGRFFSHARNRPVGYTIAYPPGHGNASRLPLGVYLHGDGGDHTSGLGGLPLARALAGAGLPAIALVAVDGGDLYWHPHPGDDPMGMLVDEIIPLCQRRGLGLARGGIGTIGISMGGYGALLLAEKHPQLITAAAAISPAIWTSYRQARAANPGAYTDAAEYADNDVVTHTGTLSDKPIRVAAGSNDPFYPGVLALARRLPRSAAIALTGGCHDGAFFASQRHASIAYLATHLLS